MRFPIILVTGFAALLLGGCVGSMPQSADEFRQVAPGAAFMKLETFVVERSLEDVTRNFRAQAEPCLNIRVTATERGRTYAHTTVTKYTPSVIAGQNRTELHVQYIHEQGVKAVHAMPEKGYYLIVTDATREAPRRTRIDMYRPTMGYDTMVTAIKGWATGKNLGCPDMSK